MNNWAMLNKIFKFFCWTFFISYFFTITILYGHGFSADTLIQLNDKSLSPIRTIYLATMYMHIPILSYNTIIQLQEKQYIKSTKQDKSCYCMHIGFNNDSDDKQNSDIICTITQEFYIPKIDQWIPAYKLIIGDELLTSNMTTKPITYIKFTSNFLPIYLFEVENSHTFFVGKHSILTHNIAMPTIWMGFSAFCGNGGTIVAAGNSFFGPMSLIINLSIGALQFAIAKIISRSSSQKEKEIPIQVIRDCGSSYIPEHKTPEREPCLNEIKTLTYTCETEQQSSTFVVSPSPCNYSLQNPILNNINYEYGSTHLSARIDATPLIQSCLTSSEQQKDRYNGPKYHRTEDWVKEFEEQTKKVFEKTNFKPHGQRVFKIIRDIPGTALKKGMYVALDALHKDHLEVYGKNREWIFVINFDGTINEQKTEQAKKTKRYPLPK